MTKKKILFVGAVALAGLCGTIGASSAGLVNNDWGCGPDGHGATVCHGTMTLFAASRDPGDFAEFNSGGAGAIFFTAQVGDDYYACAKGLTTLPESEKRYWTMALQHAGRFEVTMSGGDCTGLVLRNSSKYL